MRIGTKDLNGNVFFVCDKENWHAEGPHHHLAIGVFPYEFTRNAADAACLWLRKYHIQPCLDFSDYVVF